jgi:two-component system response regulator FlrC
MLPVLVVEDDESLRSAICDVLTMRGYPVALAENGTVAARILGRTRERFGLVLLESRMPLSRGDEFLAWLKGVHRLDALPVMLLTADDRLPGDTRIVGVLQKPFELDLLFGVVAVFCNEGIAGRVATAS